MMFMFHYSKLENTDCAKVMLLLDLFVNLKRVSDVRNLVL